MLEDIRTGQSSAPDAVEAVREFHGAVAQPGAELVIFFCSTGYDLEILAAEVNRSFAGVPVVGCTTAGEIGPRGYLDGGISGLSLPSGSFKAVSGHLDDLRQSTVEQAEAFVGGLLGRLERNAPGAHADQLFAFQMIDGLSMREELITYAFQHALGKIPLVGGSAGDATNFAHTYVFSEGRFEKTPRSWCLPPAPSPS